MEEADRLALLALIVAVIALIVSTWQLVQQLFATATDGKRFCQGSVMGVWARKTRLSWRWSQVRFETKYTVPEIRMTSGVSENALAPRVGRAIDGETQPHRRSRLMYKIPILGWLTEVFNGPPSDWHWYWELTSDRADLPLEMRRTVRPSESLQPNSLAGVWSWGFVKTWDRSYHADGPDVVSWPSLLGSIYKTQIHSIRKIVVPDEDSNGQLADSKDPECGTPKQNAEYRSLDMTEQERTHGEDRVVARLVECSWDLVPPDVVRPMARSTVGTIIVIAHRLGANWSVDPNSGNMYAEGSGHLFTCEPVRGLGVVFRYGFHAELVRTKNPGGSGRNLVPGEYLSPTVTTDQLRCGGLPIDDSAVRLRDRGETIHLIDSTGKLDFDGFLSRLRARRSNVRTLRDSPGVNSYGSPGRGYKHALEEAVSLLCPIPTLPDSHARWIIWPWRSFRQPYTPTRQEEGLKELRDHLQHCIGRKKPGTLIMEHREGNILAPLSESPLSYFDQLLKYHEIMRDDRADRSLSSGTLASRQLQIQQHILAIHKETSEVFASIPTPEGSDEEDSNSFLLDITAAQVSLAIRHAEEADEIAMREGAEKELSEADTRPRFLRELARLYVEDLCHELRVELKANKADTTPVEERTKRPDAQQKTVRTHIFAAGDTWVPRRRKV